MTVFTIGYEGLEMADFLSLLHSHDVATVVDVRQMPLSRKRGFSKKALAAMLALRGLDYVHMAQLGCPKPVRDGWRADGNWERYTRAFLAHLAQQDAALDTLGRLARHATCALLCYEADFNFCHRTMVAQALGRRCGMQVRHIPVVKAAAFGARQMALA